MRKNLLALLLLLLLIRHGNAQTNVIDSLSRLLETEKEDSSRCILLTQLGYIYIYSKPDTSLILAQQGLAIARANKFTKEEAWCLNLMGSAFRLTGNNSKALGLYLQALKKAESVNYKEGLGSILSNIGVVYSFQEDYRKSLEYYFKAKAIDENLKDQFSVGYDLVNLGDCYEKLNILDSARYYTNLGYNTAVRNKDDNLTGFALNNLGNIYAKMEQPAIALEYYRSALPYFYQIESYESICESSLGMAKIFQQAGQKDSCLHYARLSMTIAKKSGFTMRVMNASKFLADYYKADQNIDSAYAYMATTIAAKDSLYSQEKDRELQSLSFDEAMRQMEIADASATAAEERSRNIQYAILAIGIIGFLTIFILLTNSVIINERWVRFLGVLGLLLLFEFINLLIHPYIGGITHHSPVLMLAISVAIASLLIPLHHKIEHWVTHKMVAKNIRLRLEAAKRTIAKLEAEVNEHKEEGE